jgi:hypothetical protein
MDGLANHVVQATRSDVLGPAILDFLDRHTGMAAPESRT